MISCGTDHTAGRRLDYVGSLKTMLEEIDMLENTAAEAKPRYRMRARRVSKDAPTLTDDEARGVCRVYLADVCCIDRAFRYRCKRVGVHCPPTWRESASPSSSATRRGNADAREIGSAGQLFWRAAAAYPLYPWHARARRRRRS